MKSLQSFSPNQFGEKLCSLRIPFFEGSLVETTIMRDLDVFFQNFFLLLSPKELIIFSQLQGLLYIPMSQASYKKLKILAYEELDPIKNQISQNNRLFCNNLQIIDISTVLLLHSFILFLSNLSNKKLNVCFRGCIMNDMF